MLSPDEVASNWQESRKLLQKVKSVIEKMHAAVASSGMSTASLGQNTTQCLKTVNGFLARGPNVPGALTTVSQHQDDAHLALKKTRASLLNFSNGLALALAELAGTADGAATANKAVKACSKKLKGCWSQWPSAETRLRILLGVPREPEQALSSSSGSGCSLPGAQLKMPAGQLLATPQHMRVVVTSAQKAARHARFATDTASGHMDDPERGGLLRCDDGSIAQGTSSALEKDYLRLTPGQMPRISDVRPPVVLARALAHVQARWRRVEVSYEWVCSQLKAIRQDVVVQGVGRDLAAQVYECHARMALECDDIGSLQQCQSMLKPLHAATGFQGDTCMEFAAYRLMHSAMASAEGHGAELQSLPPHALQHEYVVYANRVSRAYMQRQLVSLLNLYSSTFRMAVYLLDTMLERLRGPFLRSLLTAFRPSLDSATASAWLGFYVSDRAEAATATEYLCGRGCVLQAADGRRRHRVGPGVSIDCKLSLQNWCSASSA